MNFGEKELDDFCLHPFCQYSQAQMLARVSPRPLGLYRENINSSSKIVNFVEIERGEFLDTFVDVDIRLFQICYI